MTAKVFTCLALLCVLLSCQSSQEEQLARNYYQALDESDFARISELQYDSVRVKEGEFLSSYTVKDYVNWLRWDSVFKPTYKILDLKPMEGGIAVTISKDDERIQFLNGQPLVTKERLRFKEGKIHSLEIMEYVSFDNAQWDFNREELVAWINEHHPELNGFINDQTLQGGLNYLKALELFKKKGDRDSITVKIPLVEKTIQ